MSHTSWRRRSSALIAAVGAGCVVLATAGPAQADPSVGATPHQLPGTVSPQISGKKPMAAADSSTKNTVQLWLATRGDAAGFATKVSTPGDTAFHHYLTPDQYTKTYGASQRTVQQVKSWLKSQGFTHISTDKQQNYVSAKAPVGTVQKAFKVKMGQYRVAGPNGKKHTVTANDRDVTLPAKLTDKVVGVTGLNNAQPEAFHSQQHRAKASKAAAQKNCSTYYGQKTKSGLPKYHGATKLPYVGCGYNAKQLRGAYAMNDSNTGKGQTVAYVEIGTPYKMVKSLTRFAKLGGLSKPKASQYQQLALGKGNDCGNPFDVEEQLDVEAGYAMAPGAKHLLVGGDSCAEKYQGVQPLFDADLAIVNGNGNAPLATIASNSWGLNSETMPAAYSKIMHTILTRAAAEGVGMYFSSGDNPGVAIPANDPFAISVGGTSLGIGSKGQRLFETGWSNEFLEINGKKYDNLGIGRSAAGGGTSLSWKQPAYQRKVVPASVSTPAQGDTTEPRRAVPDLSAVADAYTGIQQVDVEENGKKGDIYDVFPDGGTSLASPLVAGMIASAQQGQATPFGFADPTLYQLAGTKAVHDALPVTDKTPAARTALFCPASNDLCFDNGASSVQTLDSQDRSYTDQSTTKGYDTMTGIGTPNGQPFISALRKANAANASSTLADTVSHRH